MGFLVQLKSEGSQEDFTLMPNGTYVTYALA